MDSVSSGAAAFRARTGLYLTGQGRFRDTTTVPKYRIDRIADLARQLAFAPAETRFLQVTSAETLLHEIDASKAYPLEFIVFRITGYHPRAQRTGLGPDLLTGLALHHDLGLLIEELSDSLDLQAAEAGEPVLSIDDVTEKFNVSSKTIQRWRRRGLPARRFTFADGRKRVGFCLSSVEKFFSAQRDKVIGGVNLSGVNLSRVEAPEHAELLRRARLLARSGCCEQEIARRIARRLGRSPLTVLHTIRKHDQENPREAVIPSAAAQLDERTRARALKGYRRGLRIAVLARRFKHPRSAIYRLVLDERIDRLSRRKMRFIDDPLYHQPDAELTVATIARQEDLGVGPRIEETRIPRDLPPYLQALYRTPLLTPGRERALFLNFNFHKFQFVMARRRLDPQFARSRELKILENHARLANEVKNQIVQANLRLVVSIARKHLRSHLSLMELISDGNITLMRAIESFDAHKGNRFSTYATLSLMKGFARSVPLLQSQGLPIHRVALVMDLPDRRYQGADARLIEQDEVRQLLGKLEEGERHVLLAHYGLPCDGMTGGSRESSPATFEQVAVRLGLTTRRVRQIEQAAFVKLRALSFG
jgi:RNA polymerase primary sigma factor